MEHGDQLLGTRELAQLSGLSRHTWRRWLRERRLPVVVLGRAVRVTAADFRRFIASKRTGPGSA